MKGIKFNAEMVNAILEGRKTQTRRVADVRNDNNIVTPLGKSHILDSVSYCPFGKIGDKLFVKEDFYEYLTNRGFAGFEARENLIKISSHYMKQHQSRITLEITDIRVERLNEISEEDAKAEGIKVFPCAKCGYTESEQNIHLDHHLCVSGNLKSNFEETWNSIYKKDKPKQWESNPWVWVIEFKKILTKNHD